MNAISKCLLSGVRTKDEGLADAIREELELIHKPQSPEALAAVRARADARYDLIELDGLHYRRIEMESKRMAGILDRQAVIQFEKDQKKWRKTSWLYRNVIGRTVLGAEMLRAIWSEIAEALSPECPGMTLEMAFRAVLAEGASENIQETNAEGWWVMGRYLAMHENPEIAIKLWVKKSRAGDSPTHVRRALHYRAKFPDAGEARSGLRMRAIERMGYWAAEHERLKLEELTYQSKLAEYGAETGFGEKSFMAEARISIKVRKQAFDIVDKLERRLSAIKQSDHRAANAARKGMNLESSPRKNEIDDSNQTSRGLHVSGSGLRPTESSQPLLVGGQSEIDLRMIQSHRYQAIPEISKPHKGRPKRLFRR